MLKHRPAGHHRHWPDRKALMSRRLTVQRIDEPKLGLVPNLAILALVALGNQQASENAVSRNSRSKR